MRRSSWAIIALIIVLVGAMLPPSPADSAQGEMGRSVLEELICGADCVVVGTVAERTSYWNDERTGIYTSVVLIVEGSWKGGVSQDRVTVTSPGGEVDDIGQRVSGMPGFEHGERAVVLLKRIAEGQTPVSKMAQLQVSGEQFEVHGGFRGKFTVVEDVVGGVSLATFEGRVIAFLEGQATTLCELEDSLSVATSGYSYSGLSWPHPPAPVVSYRINENTADCTGEGAAVQAAAATWNAAGASFAFNYAGTTTATGYRYNGVNEILWRNVGSGGPLAHAIVWYDPRNNTIVECDMEFNDYYLWSTAATPSSGRYDVQTIALHEFGHFLCLDDLYNAADSAKVMYGYGFPGTTKRVLHAGDIAGIRHIYGTVPVPPEAPSGLTANAVSSSRIDLNWQDNSDNESGFRIERRTGTGSYSEIATVGAGVASYSSMSLSAGTTYYYRVRGYSAAGDSAYSNEASATTLHLLAYAARGLPAAVAPGDIFEVTLTFTSPADGFNAVGLEDVVPAGWTVSVNTTRCTPAANAANPDSPWTTDLAAYLWFGPYDEGIVFAAVFEVQIPANAPLGTYTFPDGTLEYYLGTEGPHVQAIIGDFELEVASAVIGGEIREVNCDVMPGATVTLYQNGTVMATAVTDGDGNYALAVPGPGEYTVMASRDGFRSKERTILVNEPTEHTVNFVADHGLIPNAPEMSYVLARINLWQFGESPCKLTTARVLAVINAWQFPV